MLHFGKLTDYQDTRLYEMKRAGMKRYDCAVYGGEHLRNYGVPMNDTICEAHIYEDCVKAMHDHYQKLLKHDSGFFTDFESSIYYVITDYSTGGGYRDPDSIRIDVKDLNKLAYMLQFFDVGKKTTKRTTKKAAATEQQDEA